MPIEFDHPDEIPEQRYYEQVQPSDDIEPHEDLLQASREATAYADKKHMERMREGYDLLNALLIAHNDPRSTWYRLFTPEQIAALDYITHSWELRNCRTQPD